MYESEKNTTNFVADEGKNKKFMTILGTKLVLLVKVYEGYFCLCFHLFHNILRHFSSRMAILFHNLTLSEKKLLSTGGT